MQIRPAIAADLDRLIEIDATIESTRYLHVDRTGEGLSAVWKLDERPLRSKLVEQNALDEDRRFSLKQVIAGIEDGIALVVEHDGELVALAAAELENELLRLLDLRVDFDQRRQGIGSGLLYQLITHAREKGVRAVAARTLTNNLPANAFLAKASFEMTGLDTHWLSNHDLVKESVSLFWYLPLS